MTVGLGDNSLLQGAFASVWQSLLSEKESYLEATSWTSLRTFSDLLMKCMPHLPAGNRHYKYKVLLTVQYQIIKPPT